MMDQIKATAWRRLMECHATVLGRLATDLESGSGFGVGWYDVLVHLAEAPGHRLRMSGLAETLLLSRSWLTRRIDQMEAAGLVARRSSQEDGRGTYAELTPAGLRAFRSAKRAHLKSVERHFLSHLTSSEAQTLERILHRVTTEVRASES
jgi:DNA-binding MarR family transcriptional regulator